MRKKRNIKTINEKRERKKEKLLWEHPFVEGHLTELNKKQES